MLCMKNWLTFHKIVGILFILIGVVSYPTPIPGSTILIMLGFIWIIGKNKTISFFKKHLTKKIFKSLKINRVVKKL